MAPIQSRMEKPPKSCRQNLTHSGTVGGGVKVFGPSLARISIALALVRPWGTGIFRNERLSAVTGNLITTQRPSFQAGLKSCFTAKAAEHQVSLPGLFNTTSIIKVLIYNALLDVPTEDSLPNFFPVCQRLIYKKFCANIYNTLI